MKYYLLNKISEIGLKTIQAPDEITTNINEADVILVRSADMNNMDLPRNIIGVARAGVGVNNIPLKKFADEGIVVFNTPGANANAVKELVLCGLLLGSRDVIGGIDWVNNNKDNESLKELVEKNKSQFAGKELKNKKMGVLGLGGRGVLVSNSCHVLDMDVLGYDPFLSINNAMRLSRSVKYCKDTKEIYKQCDYISIHIPLTKETKQMVNKEAFSQMKKGTVLLNFSREEIVNEEDLKEAIDKGIIKKYITDFPSYELMKCKNVIAIPHLGASTAEAEDNCACMAIDQLKDYFEKGDIKNSVNYPTCEIGFKSTEERVIINHKNIVGMINKFTDIIVENNGNIETMFNKSLGEYAYTIFDIDTKIASKVIDDISNIDGVKRVRVI